MKKLIPVLFLLAALESSSALIRYVDSSVGTSGNGQSWATAWKNLTNITGVGAGDTVYVSGGSTSKTYSVNGVLSLPNGSAGNPFTLSSGHDPGHDGLVIFQNTGGYTAFTSGQNWVTMDGWWNGVKHFRVAGWEYIAFYPQIGSASSTGLIFRGFDQGTELAVFSLWEADQCEVGWCAWAPSNDQDQHPRVAGPGKATTGTYGRNSIHDCVMVIDCSTNGFGNDGIKESSHTDIYNNRIIGNVIVGAGGDHQDGFQAADGTRYTRFYNNYFENLANYCIFLQNVDNHFLIFNNVFNYTDSSLLNNQGIATGGIHNSFDDHKYFNNTFVNVDNAWALWNDGASTTTNCYIQNNLLYNSGALVRGGSATISNNSNGGTTGIAFVNQGAKDFHLTSAATAAIGQGVNPASAVITGVLTTDADGNSRSNPWDLGAYKFGAAAPDTTPPTVSSASINPAGNQVSLTFSEPVQAGSGGSGGFTLSMSGGTSVMGSPTGVGSNLIIFNLSRVINAGETGPLSYIQPGSGWQDLAPAHNALTSFATLSVINSSTQGVTATPVITLPAGPYFGAQTTTITSSDTGAGAVIHYTTDGSTPTGASPTYSSPVSIASNQTIQAIVTWAGHPNSAVASSAFEVVSWVSSGTSWKTFSVGQKTGTFTWNFSVLAPAAGSDCVVGLGPSAVSAYTGMAAIVQFNANTINAINGGGYTTGPAYSPGAAYNFAATINVSAHTWSVSVTPAAGGATTAIVTGAAFRTEQAAAAQLSSIGIQANSGTITVSNMAFPSGPSSSRYIGIRGVPAAGGAVP